RPLIAGRRLVAGGRLVGGRRLVFVAERRRLVLVGGRQLVPGRQLVADGRWRAGRIPGWELVRRWGSLVLLRGWGSGNLKPPLRPGVSGDGREAGSPGGGYGASVRLQFDLPPVRVGGDHTRACPNTRRQVVELEFDRPLAAL